MYWKVSILVACRLEPPWGRMRQAGWGATVAMLSPTGQGQFCPLNSPKNSVGKNPVIPWKNPVPPKKIWRKNRGFPFDKLPGPLPATEQLPQYIFPPSIYRFSEKFSQGIYRFSQGQSGFFPRSEEKIWQWRKKFGTEGKLTNCVEAIFSVSRHTERCALASC